MREATKTGGHVIVAGGERLRPRVAAVLRDQGVEVTESASVDREALVAAGIDSAASLILTADNDVGNLSAALAARDHNPDLRIVLRTFNVGLLRQLESLLPGVRLVSASQVAAPAFIAAATATAGPAPAQRRRQRGTVGFALDLAGDRLVQLLGAVVTGIIAISAVVFGVFHDLSPIDALYFTVTVVTTTGFGDISVGEAAWPLKAYAVALMLTGAAALATLLALVTEVLVTARIAAALGNVPRDISDHAVVAGFGTLGFRIAEQLVESGERVVAISLAGDGRFVAAARSLGIPIVIGDIAIPETLDEARIDRARCLLCVSDSDVANLEAGLNARSASSDIPLVLRIYDVDLAARVEAQLGLRSFSVASLTASAFAAEAVGEVEADEDHRAAA